MGYKKILTRVTVAFALLVLFLTFYSRTLADMRLPQVSLAFIQPGIIAPEAMSSGVVSPANTGRIFAPVSGRITQIMEPGDIITSNSILFTISVDVRTLYDQLDGVHHEQRVVALNLERTRNELANAQRQLTQIQGEPLSTPTPPVLSLLEFDLQLTANTNDREALYESIKTLEDLYNMGIIPRQQITDRENDLLRLIQARENIYQRREQAIEAHERALVNYDEGLETAGRVRETQIRNQQSLVTQLSFQLRALQLDDERIAGRIESLSERIDEGGIYEVRLEAGNMFNRVVTHILSGLDIGSHVAEGMPVMMTAIRDNQFTIEATFPQSQDFIGTNQGASITIGTTEIEGTTSRVIPRGGRYIVTVDLRSNQLSGGELAWVTIRDRAANQRSVIPQSALRRHTTGYYILYVEAEDRRLGTHYYLRSVPVEVRGRDARSVAISGAHGQSLPTGPIVINSDMPVAAGMRVRLVDGNDFFPAR
jgi:hypothetical protein